MVTKHPKLLACILLTLAILNGWIFLYFLDYGQGKTVTWGVSFSDKYARELEVDWQAAYIAILDELNVSHVRLAAYWDQIEHVQDEFDFTDLDWQVSEATKRNRSIILTVGRRTPRWPECHDPAWLKSLAPLAVREQQFDFVQRVIARYKDNPSVIAWQVENEPLLRFFGECPSPNIRLLKDEVDAVKIFDSSRPIIITDSGELNHWQTAGSVSDVLGVTMYRIVWNKSLGFLDYWFIPPAAYRLKADITKMLHKNLHEVIVTELQMEPWTFDKRMIDMTREEREQSFNLARFNANISYFRRTGFNESYLWGAEYWYWLKIQGDPELWDAAKKLWQ